MESAITSTLLALSFISSYAHASDSATIVCTSPRYRLTAIDHRAPDGVYAGAVKLDSDHQSPGQETGSQLFIGKVSINFT